MSDTDVNPSGLDPSLAFLIHSVPLKTAGQVLNRCQRSLYELIGLGLLDAVKNGTSTEITVESIRRYQANLPRANIKPPKPPNLENLDKLHAKQAAERAKRRASRRRRVVAR